MAEAVGFVGVGNMGAPMCRRLLDAGFDLTIFDVNDDAVQALVDLGAEKAASPAAVASAADMVLISLPTPDVVRQVTLGPAGIASGKRIKTYVDLSTTGPSLAVEIAAALVEKDIATVDTPVSGGVAGAVAGTLAVMAACSDAELERARPVLEVIGRVFHVGTNAGMGQTMKLANNLLSATALAISSEAMVMGVKAGLDPRIMLEVINSGSGKNTATDGKFASAILPRKFDLGFSVGLMHKDVELCLAEAEAMRVPMDLAGTVLEVWEQALAVLGADADFSEFVKCVETRAGVEVKPPEDS